MSSRSRSARLALTIGLAGGVLVAVPAAVPAGVVQAVAGPPVISEIMFHPESAEDDWEWIEIFNPGDEALDMAGFVVDDVNSVAHTEANIASGSIPPGGSGILYNVDDVSAADFEAAWGVGINLIAVTNWTAMGLNNSGDTIGIWSDFASYSGDNTTQANALVSVAYPGSLDDGAGSLHLTDLGDQNSWALSLDGLVTPVGTSITAAAAGGNTGLDVGSPVAAPPTPSAPVISEVMFNPASDEDDWEWIEIHNPGAVDFDLTGWVVDDVNSVAHPTANIAGGSIPAGGSGILFNVDDVAAADFEAAWGTGINLIPVTNWSAMGLNNGGDTIGLWSDFASYSGDNVDQLNALVSAGYPNIDDGAGSVYLTDLADQASFALSTDGVVTPVGTAYVAAAAGGNSGADIGSPGGTPVPAAAPFFTQYVEGSSNNKAIEVANLDAAAVDITGWTLELYSNGSATATTTSTITGVIAPGDVYVAYNSSASAAIQAVGDEALSAVNWNGDDAIVLRDLGGAVIDSIGQVGVDPGSEWGDSTVGTQNDTICRNPGITAGDTEPDDVFDPAVEWFSIGNDNIAGLGSVDCDGGTGGGDAELISAIQGTGSTVAIAGPVTVEAIVTSLFTRDDVLDGFFVQEEDTDADADPNTSEGIFVFCRGNCPTGLAVGDLVEVSGDATDFFGMSQVDMTAGSVTVVSSGNALPAPTVLDLPAPAGTDAEATYESVEGMIVQYADTLVVSEYFQLGRFGQVVLTDEARPFQYTQTNTPDVAGYAAFLADLATRRIILDDDNNDNNDPISDGPDEAYPYPVPGLDVTNLFRGGDTITGLTGVMHWSFPGSGDNTWRLRPIQDPNVSYDFTSENPRASIEEIDGDFRVATLNVLNYFSTIDVTPSRNEGDCGPSGTLDCRGADSENERIRQLDKIVAAMLEIDADVYGLVELENDGDDGALQDIVDALNAAQTTTIYDYVATGFIGTDAIKVGYVYDTSTAATVGSFAVLDSSVDPTFIDTKNRPALIQTFEETASDERLTLAVNHFKSKGSACDDVGDPGLNDGTGNCNLTRTTAAQALADYLATDPTGSGDPDFMIIGDLNAYLAEDPIVALQNAGYTDLASTFIGPDAYSFVFDGQLGTLDYALANAFLLPQVVGVTEWHINADEINLLDYNDEIEDAGESFFERESAVGDLYDPDPYRSSDHDPVVVGLDLGQAGNCPDAPNVSKIHEIQGDGAATPCDGEDVIIEGVVVGDYEGSSPNLRGFYVQEEDADADGDPATSEGIFVFNFDDDDVDLGDLVRVTSTAGEFQGQTQLGAPDEIVVISTDQGALVTPTEASLPVASADAFEAIEGMSVTFPQELFVTEFFQLGRFGQVVVSSGDRLDNPTAVAEPGVDANAVQAANDLNRLIIDDTTNDQNPEPIIYGGNGAPLTAENPLRGADVTVGATGVMTFTWAGNSASGNAYRLRPADAGSTGDIVFETRNPRPEAKPDVGGSLEVASFNVLNYFLTIDDGSDACGPIGAKDGCRGADSTEEFERQRVKLLDALVDLDADVVGLIELENTELADGSAVQPLADIVDGLNDLQGAGTWDFVDTGVIGTDVIKVGFIYQPAAVSTIGEFAVIDSSVDPRFDDDLNRPTLAQTFVEAETGEVMTVAVNHLKSKSCRDAMGAEMDQGDGQGCYNPARTAAAQAIVDWLATDPTDSGDDDVLVIGDLNAYAQEDPIDVFAAAGYVDLAPVYADAGETPYSFVFDGQWGYLDYALASPSIVGQVTGAAEYHINADEVPVLDYNTNFQSPTQIDDLFAPDEFRTSDHDPVLVGLALDAAPGGKVVAVPNVLWPANGKLRNVYVFGFEGWSLLDTEIVEVTSSQADSGLSRRDRPNDIRIVNDHRVKLRAESFGSENRVYEILVKVDGGGQIRYETETVTVLRRFSRWFR